MGDVRTERGDLVPEGWAEIYRRALTDNYDGLSNGATVLVITELASWQARAEQARNEALEEAARECEEFAAYYAPEFMAAPFPKGYVFKPEETRAAMHFAHGRFKACASKLREMIVSRSTDLEREDGK
jgi:hypothetical protein